MTYEDEALKGVPPEVSLMDPRVRELLDEARRAGKKRSVQKTTKVGGQEYTVEGYDPQRDQRR